MSLRIHFHLVTIFPEIFASYFSSSILKRAQAAGHIAISTYDLRDWSRDKHRKVDDSPYGGGAGMVMKVEPFDRCVAAIKKKITRGSQKSPQRLVRVILLSAKGKRYTQRDVKRLSGYQHLVLLSGRYEGVDERVAKYVADEELSIGDFVLTGGEVPTMAIVDSVARLVPGVLQNAESLQRESHREYGFLEHPQYTKPEVYQKWKVPKVLLSGDHAKVEEWRQQKSKTE
ncbi:tRNA (guanosine(37)-N1)-methyltransferase TrmD [Patescibacteria group bacterium]|nr:MAG: tRNA (guanosine(37)-N1)-methyltransferase TrmD [Patescibacteria group bacterium]